jgi:beta-galactosidase
VEVYTNQPAAQLLLGGRSLGTQPAVAGVARFSVPFTAGLNQLRAQLSGQPLADEATIDFQLIPSRLADPRLPFTELNVSLGDERTFTDYKLHQVWLPEQPYAPGSWGYVGGHVYKLPGDRLPYGSDRDILGTDYDALYETQRLGLREFRLDVPDGQYEVTLHFAELEAASAAEQLAYNLAGEKAATPATAPASRLFSVLVNGQPVLPGLSSATYLLPLQAASFKLPVTAQGGQGIRLTFDASQGEAFLNGVQVRRLF